MSSGSADLVLRAVREGLILVLLVSAPPLLASLLVGLVVGALQSATQIQDHSIAFVSKLVAVFAVLLMSGPLLGSHVVRFSRALLALVPMIR
jgi:flagellar biosynthesis protein FliQ